MLRFMLLVKKYKAKYESNTEFMSVTTSKIDLALLVIFSEHLQSDIPV